MGEEQSLTSVYTWGDQLEGSLVEKGLEDTKLTVSQQCVLGA